MKDQKTEARSRLILPLIAAAGVGVGLVLAFTSPPDALQGNFVRILYLHVPAAWLAFLAFGLTAIGSIGWLFTKKSFWDRLAHSSAEVGVVFTAITLLTGMIWGRPVWGVFWSWADPRMATTALMFFVYLGYLGLRRAIPDREVRARRSAVLGAIAVVQIPLVYFSVYLWRGIHQVPTIRPDGPQMDAAMLTAFLVNLAVFNVVYLAFLVGRYRLAVQEEAVDQSIASTVTSPRLGGAFDG